MQEAHRCSMTPAEIARGLTKAQWEAMMASVDFGTYRMVGGDNAEVEALNEAGATMYGIVVRPVLAAILEQ